MAGGNAGGNHPADGGGGGGGGGPDGAGGNYANGDTNGFTGGDGYNTVPIGCTAAGGGSTGDGYISITYNDFYGQLYEGGLVTRDEAARTITHVFFNPGSYQLTNIVY